MRYKKGRFLQHSVSLPAKAWTCPWFLLNQFVLFFPTGGPVVTVTPSMAVVQVGKEARFKCKASGLPTPNIRWQKVNDSLPSKHFINGGVLIIRSVMKHDAGTYVCQGSNNAGNSEKHGVLKIKGKTIGIWENKYFKLKKFIYVLVFVSFF